MDIDAAIKLRDKLDAFYKENVDLVSITGTTDEFQAWRDELEYFIEQDAEETAERERNEFVRQNKQTMGDVV